MAGYKEKTCSGLYSWTDPQCVDCEYEKQCRRERFQDERENYYDDSDEEQEEE